MAELRGEGITKVFPNGARALDGVSFVAPAGAVLTLLGPSGCGKSTLLRIAAGLEQPTAGSLTLDGRSLDGVPPGERDIGFVFQNYALYPHLSVARNLSLGLEVRKVARAEIQERVREVATLLGINDLLERRPAQISGGQQQRVALGRALVRRPRLYLMDEPLSNLDAVLRESTRGELKALFRRLAATVVYVTHDQAEAMSLSDRILVMGEGRVRQCAPPMELYAEPADLFTATFVGSPRMTVWRGRRKGDALEVGGFAMALRNGLPGSGDLCVGIRPEDVELAEQPLDGGWEGTVHLIEPMGDRVLLTVRIGQETLRAFGALRAWPEKLWARVSPDKIHCFDATTEKRVG